MMPATEAKKPTGIEKRLLCARLYERAKIFYEDPTNKRRFEEWQKTRRRKTE